MTERTCPICAKTYEADDVRLRHGRQTTCGRACSYKLRASLNTKRVEVVCSCCGAKFDRAPSGVKSKHEGVYCSRECHYRGRSLGLTRREVSEPYALTAEIDRAAVSRKIWATRRQNGTDRHSEATREKLRFATAKQIASSSGRQISNVENEVAQVLARMGVPFRRQVAVRDPQTGRFCGLPDFMLDDGSVLEVNGTFWHADPRAFPSGPIFPSQRRTAERYAAKVAALNRLGIQVREVWEADVAQDAEDAVRIALT